MKRVLRFEEPASSSLQNNWKIKGIKRNKDDIRTYPYVQISYGHIIFPILFSYRVFFHHFYAFWNYILLSVF